MHDSGCEGKPKYWSQRIHKTVWAVDKTLHFHQNQVKKNLEQDQEKQNLILPQKMIFEKLRAVTLAASN